MGKESTIIYRCESHNPAIRNKRFKGIWHDHPDTKRKSWWSLPSPRDDKLNYILDEEVCGCTSLKQFHIWWPKGKWVTNRPNNQYLIFSVPKEYVRKGKKQAVFIRKHATIIGALTKDHKRVFFDESFTYRDYKRQKRKCIGNW